MSYKGLVNLTDGERSTTLASSNIVLKRVSGEAEVYATNSSINTNYATKVVRRLA